MQNKYAGKCGKCGKWVEAMAGICTKVEGKWTSFHTACNAGAAAASIERTIQSKVRQLTADGRVLTPYEPENLPVVKSMPGAKWDMQAKIWRVSLSMGDRPRLLELADRIGLDVAPALREQEAKREQTDAEKMAAAAGAYDYQLEGVRFLRENGRRLLGDDMGLGKTLQALMAIQRPALVVCPATLKGNWADEVAKWRPDLTAIVLSGKNAWQLPKQGEVVITNYDILPDLTEKQLLELADVVIVVDECHRAKNYKALRTKRLTRMTAVAAQVFALTGTPLMNRPLELWGVLSAMDMARKAYNSFSNFVKVFNGFKGRYGYEFGTPSEAAAGMLKRVMLRRVKTEVLKQLPRKTYSTITVPVADKRLANEIEQAWEDLDEAGYGLSSDDLPPFSMISSIRALLAKSRIPQLLDMVADYEDAGKPVIVFSAYRAPVEELGQREGWAMILGGTPNEERTEIVKRFQNGELKGLALTIAAGGVGLTLTKADTALFCDLDFVPANNLQAEDRICRIGQQSDSCNIIRLVTDHVLDTHVQGLLAKKMRLIEQVVESDVTGVAKEGLSPEKAARMRQDALAKLEEAIASSKAEIEQQDRAVATEWAASVAAKDGIELTGEQLGRAEAIRDRIINDMEMMIARCDGAQVKDNVGFNKPDAGRAYRILAALETSPVAVLVADRLLHKYRGTQLAHI